jgi:hypothetical protein
LPTSDQLIQLARLAESGKGTASYPHLELTFMTHIAVQVHAVSAYPEKWHGGALLDRSPRLNKKRPLSRWEISFTFKVFRYTF